MLFVREVGIPNSFLVTVVFHCLPNGRYLHPGKIDRKKPNAEFLREKPVQRALVKAIIENLIDLNDPRCGLIICGYSVAVVNKTMCIRNSFVRYALARFEAMPLCEPSTTPSYQKHWHSNTHAQFWCERIAARGRRCAHHKSTRSSHCIRSSRSGQCTLLCDYKTFSSKFAIGESHSTGASSAHSRRHRKFPLNFT